MLTMQLHVLHGLRSSSLPDTASAVVCDGLDGTKSCWLHIFNISKPGVLYAAGAVYEGKFYVISPNDDDTPDTMRVYDFKQQEWALWRLSVNPPAALNVLLGVHEDHLIQYGGERE